MSGEFPKVSPTSENPRHGETEPPPLWWSPTGGLIRGYGNAGCDDAVPLGVIEDPKHRGPSYERGFRDGYLACRAGVPDPTEEDQ